MKLTRSVARTLILIRGPQANKKPAQVVDTSAGSRLQAQGLAYFSRAKVKIGWFSETFRFSHMTRFEPFGRLALPLIAGAFGAILYILSPLSHQAFCAPLNFPVIVAPDGASIVPGSAP